MYSQFSIISFKLLKFVLKISDREDFEKFTTFLKDCVTHTNTSVQLLKKAEKMTKEAGQSDVRGRSHMGRGSTFRNFR